MSKAATTGTGIDSDNHESSTSSRRGLRTSAKARRYGLGALAATAAVAGIALVGPSGAGASTREDPALQISARAEVAFDTSGYGGNGGNGGGIYLNHSEAPAQRLGRGNG